MKRGHKNPLSQPAFRHGKRKNGQANKTTDFRLQQIGTWMKSADPEEITRRDKKIQEKEEPMKTPLIYLLQTILFSIVLQVYRFKLT